MSSKRNKNWLQVGNFLLGKEKNSKGEFVCVKSLVQDWSIRWREDSMMYGQMLNLMKNEGAHEYLYCLLAMMYITTTHPHDIASYANKKGIPFMNGIAKLIKEEAEYEMSLMSQDESMTDEEALKEVGDMEEIKQTLEQMEKGEDV